MVARTGPCTKCVMCSKQLTGQVYHVPNDAPDVELRGKACCRTCQTKARNLTCAVCLRQLTVRVYHVPNNAPDVKLRGQPCCRGCQTKEREKINLEKGNTCKCEWGGLHVTTVTVGTLETNVWECGRCHNKYYMRTWRDAKNKRDGKTVQKRHRNLFRAMLAQRKRRNEGK